MRRLEAEMAEVRCDLVAARALERAAETRSAKERTPESEAAYRGRREETARVQRRFASLLEEIARQERHRCTAGAPMPQKGSEAG